MKTTLFSLLFLFISFSLHSQEIIFEEEITEEEDYEVVHNTTVVLKSDLSAGLDQNKIDVAFKQGKLKKPTLDNLNILDFCGKYYENYKFDHVVPLVLNKGIYLPKNFKEYMVLTDNKTTKKGIIEELNTMDTNGKMKEKKNVFYLWLHFVSDNTNNVSIETTIFTSDDFKDSMKKAIN